MRRYSDLPVTALAFSLRNRGTERWAVEFSGSKERESGVSELVVSTDISIDGLRSLASIIRPDI